MGILPLGKEKGEVSDGFDFRLNAGLHSIWCKGWDEVCCYSVAPTLGVLLRVRGCGMYCQPRSLRVLKLTCDCISACLCEYVHRVSQGPVTPFILSTEASFTVCFMKIFFSMQLKSVLYEAVEIYVLEWD